MAFSSGNVSVTLEDILNKVQEIDILYYYLGVTTIPCVIKSPVRKDNHPSLGFYTKDGKRIYWIDFATKERGGLFDLLSSLWGKSYIEVLEKIYNDIIKTNIQSSEIQPKVVYSVSTTKDILDNVDLQCCTREWRDYDLKYWSSYGITLEWLKYADVYPISYKIIIKGDSKYIFGVDKYAYAYVERKENKVTLKIYQPFNTLGYKWSNKHDSSVISLWTKIPHTGNIVCICSSLKDALCLWSNTGIPSIALQGEGYSMSNTAIEELKRRYLNIYILFDNDNAGLLDAQKLAETTGFTNIVLPSFEGGKDISDLYKVLNNKHQFQTIILNLFKNSNT